MKKVIAIVGPTGVGKSDLGIKLAKHYNTEIISGDSVQVYRGLNIGSGKVTIEEMKEVKHHLIDILDPIEDYSVSDFQNYSRELIDKVNVPLIVGGTGFYIKSALFNYEFNAPKRTDIYENLSNEELYNKLVLLNDTNIPDINNRKRLLRRLEILEFGEEPVNKDEPIYDYLIIGLTLEREKLYERINNRVDKMIDSGLVEEVRSFYDKGIRTKSLTSIGYKELYDYFDGLTDLNKAIELIKQHSRNYAKRQYTWFNNQMKTNWIDIEKTDPFTESIKLIDEFLKQ